VLNTAHHEAMVIRGGRVIDAAAGRDEIADVFITNGVIVAAPRRDALVLDATGLIVCPGLMDLHVHLREPGQSHKETIESGTAAAAAGGFTLVACMPNTQPPLDTPDAVRWVIERASEADHCKVAPVAAITKVRGGRELTDFAALLGAGAAAFSDDGTGVEDDGVMRSAFERASDLDALLIQHCEYKAISAGGVMHLGEVSRRLGLAGLDPRSEEAMIERDIDLCRRTGGRYHVAHISTAKAIDLVRRAKDEGLPVTAEVCTHHLMLTDETCANADPNTKMHPPLRPQSDVDACRRGLLDGTIDCIVTDHAPHTAEEKSAGFLKAPAGIVGLETALGVAAKAMLAPPSSPLHKGGHREVVDWPRLLSWFTTGPARVLKRRPASIEIGTRADLTLIDPHSPWTVNSHQFHSKGHNTPFDGWTLTGRAVGTVRGRQVNRLLPDSRPSSIL
jgi:dihydroorotase